MKGLRHFLNINDVKLSKIGCGVFGVLSYGWKVFCGIFCFIIIIKLLKISLSIIIKGKKHIS